MNKTELTNAIITIDNSRNPAELMKLKKTDLEALLAELEWEQEHEGEETQAQSMSRKLREARARYAKTRTAKGTASADNDDTVAQALRAMEPMDVVKLAEQLLDLEPGALVHKYESLNPGQQRMNAGNRIRGAIKRGELMADDVVKAVLH